MMAAGALLKWVFIGLGPQEMHSIDDGRKGVTKLVTEQPARGTHVIALRIRKLARRKTHRAGLSGSNLNVQLRLSQQRWAQAATTTIEDIDE